MSIILKGLDMPSKNQTIVVEIFPSGKCAVMKIEKGECYELTTKGKAKAIQIPKGHGRLIDASQPSEKIIKAMPRNIYDERDEFYTEGLERAIEEIVDAPTILEAEE